LDVLVALQLPDESTAAGSQAGDHGLDVLDGECDVANARAVGRRVSVDGEWNFTGSSRLLPSGVCIVTVSASDALEPDQAVDPPALHGCLALQLESEL
jgi:hypothetical protein